MVRRVHGIKLAEKYFNNVPNNAKTYKVCGALLHAYVLQRYVKKAEAIMQNMREMGFATSSFPYNMLITLYYKIGENDKIEVLIQEMEKVISKDKKTMEVVMSAYVAASEISMMEMVLKWVEKDLNFVVDWKVYSIAGNGYLKVGLIEKALPMLEKVEEMMHLRKRKLTLEFLLTHWAGTGMKNELYRAWNTFKPQGDEKMVPSYACMITCLTKLDDIEGAEKIFEEWKSQCSTVCDNRVLICLLIAYCKEGLFEKAQSAVNKALEGGKPHASLWNVLAMGYKRDNQMAKAAEMLKRALSVGKQRWSPNSITLAAFLDHLEGQGDVGRTEDTIRLLKKLGPLTRDIYHRWLRICVATGASVSEVLDHMKMDGISTNEETHNILESRILGLDRILLELFS